MERGIFLSLLHLFLPLHDVRDFDFLILTNFFSFFNCHLFVNTAFRILCLYLFCILSRYVFALLHLGGRFSTPFFYHFSPHYALNWVGTYFSCPRDSLLVIHHFTAPFRPSSILVLYILIHWYLGTIDSILIDDLVCVC